MAAMEKNLLFNDVIVVKEFNPTNSNAPSWYKEYEKGHIESVGFTPDADRIRFMFEMLKSASEKANSYDPKDIAYALEGMEARSVDGGKAVIERMTIKCTLICGPTSSEKTEQSIMYRGQDFDIYINVGNIQWKTLLLIPQNERP